jgi:hypothetical protein
MLFLDALLRSAVFQMGHPEPLHPMVFTVSQHLDSFLFAIHMSNRAHLGSQLGG